MVLIPFAPAEAATLPPVEERDASREQEPMSSEQHFDELVPYHHLNKDEKLSSMFSAVQWNEPLSDEVLRHSIIESGVVNPVIVWKSKMVIVDGHRRAHMCSRLGRPVPVRYMEFESLEHAMRFAYELQASRRNLSGEDHLSLSAEWKRIVAKENQPVRSPITESLRRSAEEAGLDWEKVKSDASRMSLVDQLYFAQRIRKMAVAARQAAMREDAEDNKPQKLEQVLPVPPAAHAPLDEEVKRMESSIPEPEEEAMKRRVQEADKRIRHLVDQATSLIESVESVLRRMGAEKEAEAVDSLWSDVVDKALSSSPVAVCSGDHSRGSKNCPDCKGRGWIPRERLRRRSGS